MYKRKKYDIHYVVTETPDRVESWVHVFDWKNLMLYLLDAAQNVATQNFYYVDVLEREHKTDTLLCEGIHKLNLSNLMPQAYDYEAKNLFKTIYNEFLGIYEYPSRDWHDLFRRLKVNKSGMYFNIRWGFAVPYKQKHKSHSQSSLGVPKTLWRKVRYDVRLANIDKEYDEDYSPYLTKKSRYRSSEKLGWWDDYSRRNRSSGWKESSKRKSQWK